MTNKSDVTCPTCGKKDTWKQDNKFRPFCSDRCKLIDLGDWASEKHRIEGDETKQDDEDTKDD
ncbi:MAG TPA: DNA gyrase inhibitor YacG [Gammaproteobacteria bacterium]|jgi:endogenous inhibitor of DNA gyrase (YacG/DUF329 family)|nr:DNA gyrase inhibitor YacG [Gammaproteobacteria bacterium]